MRYKFLALLIAALIAGLGRPAHAASPVYSWGGFYIGINGGYGWDTTPSGAAFCTNPGGVIGGTGCFGANAGTTKPTGGLFGAQAGYNFQSGSFVYGVETDIQWSGIKGFGSVNSSCCVPALAPEGTNTASANLQWFGTLRGRFGFAAFDRGLVYATGGLIYGQESVSDLLAFPAAVTYPASATSTRAGWTLGGGLQFAFTQNLAAKIEGLYYDMGSQTISYTSPTLGYTSSTSFNYKGAIIRAGLNWKL
jgi:outer membrane immunogenic protein